MVCCTQPGCSQSKQQAAHKQHTAHAAPPPRAAQAHHITPTGVDTAHHCIGAHSPCVALGTTTLCCSTTEGPARGRSMTMFVIYNVSIVIYNVSIDIMVICLHTCSQYTVTQNIVVVFTTFTITLPHNHHHHRTITMASIVDELVRTGALEAGSRLGRC